MEELIITKEMRQKINTYLGYELIKQNEVGHFIYDEAPGLGKIGIEGVSLEDVVTNKQLDSNGNVEWHKNPNPHKMRGNKRPFHCKLTTVSSKKAKILIASLFSEEASDKNFLKENLESIKELRKQLNVIKKTKRTLINKMNEKLMMGPNESFMNGAIMVFSDNEERPVYRMPSSFIL